MQAGRPGGISPQLQLPLLGLFHLLISQVLFSSEFSPVSLSGLRAASDRTKQGITFVLRKIRASL